MTTYYTNSNPLMLMIKKMSSGPMILLTITLKQRMILQNIGRRVEGNVQVDISSSNSFLILLLPAKYHQKCQATFGCCKH